MIPKFPLKFFETPKFPQKMFDLPVYRESVDKAVSADNLKAVASSTPDPHVLLGLAFLARTGNPVRQEISEMAVKAEPEYAPIVAVLAIGMDGIYEKSIGELIQRDPDNALGHYLHGKLLYDSDRETEALVAFRRAAHCSELRLYESATSGALFKALEALSLTGRDRLCALSWMVSRWSNFSSNSLQFLNRTLSELAERAEIETRQEISDLLLVLAGHLFATNFTNRWFAKQALESAVFGLKARIAGAEKSLKLDGYAGGARAYVSMMLRWPGIEAGIKLEDMKLLELARCLPWGIHRAFAVADRSGMNAAYLGEMNVKSPASAKAALERAEENAVKSAKALIDAALTDTDGILGAYLNGLPPSQKTADGRWIVRYRTLVEKLMRERTDVFRAAATNEETLSALRDTGSLGRATGKG